jgi:hypothetical protein
MCDKVDAICRNLVLCESFEREQFEENNRRVRHSRHFVRQRASK